MKKLLLILFAVLASAAFGSDEDVIRRGAWFAIAKGENFVAFYDPYQTRLNTDGFVESVVYGRHINDGSIIRPSYIRLNCAQRSLQTHTFDSEGKHELSRDWHVPLEKSVGAEWMKTLCGYTTESGVKIAFIGYMENPYNRERATHIYWLPEVEHSPTVPGGKTYQMIYYVERDNRAYDGFLYLDCKKNLYATAAFLGLDLLNWEANPPPESVAGYLMYRACDKNSQ